MTQPELETFTHADAWRVGSALVARCRDEDLQVTIGIWIGMQRVFHYAFAGTSADNDCWIDRKANTVRRFGFSSHEAEERYGSLGTDFFTVFGVSPSEYALAGGDVPITVRGSVLGVVAVSGLESSVDNDLALWALGQ